MTAVAIRENDDVDNVDVESYVKGAADPETAVKELRFEFKGVNTSHPEDPCKIWVKHLRSGLWAVVVTHDNDPNKVSYFKKRIKSQGFFSQTSEVERQVDVPFSNVRRTLMKWKNEDARAVVANLLDGSALDPYPNRCTHCGSTNVSESKELCDCYTCGLWFDPLLEASDPDDPEAFLKSLPKHPEQAGMSKPNGAASYWQYKFKSKEGYDCVLALSHTPRIDERGRYALSLDVGALMCRKMQETVNLYWNSRYEFLRVETKLREAIQNFIPTVEAQPKRPNLNELHQLWKRFFEPLGADLRESLEDEISDLKAYAMQHGQPPRVTCTYSQTTPESVEHGDTSESGWIDDEGVSMAPDEFDIEDGLTLADKTADFLQKNGATEASSSTFHSGVWYSTGYHTIDYRTGTDEERNYHLVGFTEEQEYEVWKKMFPENAIR